MFTASMMTRTDSTASVRCHMVHSNEAGETRVATMYGMSTGYYADANAVIIELALGDIVTVQLQAGDQIIHSNASTVESTFSGFLLFT